MQRYDVRCDNDMGEWVRYDDAQAEIARLKAELEAARIYRDAYAAAAAMDMRKRATVTYAMYSGVDLTKRLNSLPIDPDAQKALDQMLAKAREDAIREAAAEAGRPDEDDDRLDRQCRIIVREQILDLLTDGGRG